jgi:hypothetical protein
MLESKGVLWMGRVITALVVVLLREPRGHALLPLRS